MKLSTAAATIGRTDFKMALEHSGSMEGLQYNELKLGIHNRHRLQTASYYCKYCYILVSVIATTNFGQNNNY